MTSPLFTGPQALYRNVPIHTEYYNPQAAVISSITPVSQTATTVVTATDNYYTVGTVVRFVIVKNVGMQELNQAQALVTSITSSTEFTVHADATTMTAFNSAGNTKQDSMVLPIGDINSGQINSSGRINNTLYINGSFINVSPG